MGLFDIFKSKGKSEAAPVAAGGDKNIVRLGKVAGDKHAQNYDRIEAIDALARLGTGEAAAALLRRFTFHIDPSITDQEEKDVAARGVQAAGEAAVEPIRTFCSKAESLTWPLKLLKDLVPSDRYVEEVIQL
ncbi:MAG: HEAT repeat domain-containing protein, partial [Polyangiaceae bacterium]